MSDPTLSRLKALAYAALTTGLVSLGVVSCFSDRSTSASTGSGAPCSAPTSTAGSTIVYIQSFAFLPVTVHVKAGNSVAWVNCEPTAIPHTSTSDTGAWESGSLSPAAAYVRNFATTGTFPMHCAIHPSMKATVVVDP